MLETKNLVKIYKPKKGVPVRALNNVSLKFPDSGMVFLLGKSGSGKSTLLNILGGLDRYNSGDILIKGKSSRSFRQRHFDSYRNTYVGFIFQEYNILDEFSVGVNIGLALQLQGLKPTSEQINAILKEVDLEGYGNRKPNELSGGQKQRVAIARALVKNPKIIMADEPTGALDSVTGRQVLQTLKKLSQDKLVIVVSHDREFAEQYADRIIELADGSVIRDVERTSDALAEAETPIYQDDAVVLPKDYVLTDEDKKTICDYIQRMIDRGQAPKLALGADGAERSGFEPTNVAAIQNSQDGYKLIKSRLPMKYAFKMGSSGLKHKKFRLVMTILLSCVAFVLFGLADTFASYDYVTTSVSSLSDPESQIHYAAFEKSQGYQYSDNDKQIYWEGNKAFGDEELDYIESKTGLTLYPVLTESWDTPYAIDTSFHKQLGEIDYSELQAEPFARFSGLVEAEDTLLSDMNAKLVAGKLPAPDSKEIAVSTLALASFEKYGYRENEEEKSLSIDTAEDLIGKTLQLCGNNYTICGVVDPGIDMSRYAHLDEPLDKNADFGDQLINMALSTEKRYAVNYSLMGLGIVSEGEFDRIVAGNISNLNFELTTGEYYFYPDFGCGTIDGIDTNEVVWLDGNARTELAKNEIILSYSTYMNAMYHTNELPYELDFERLHAEGGSFQAIADLELKLTYWPNSDQPIVIGPDGDVMSEPEAEHTTVKIAGILLYDGEVSCVLSDKLLQTLTPNAKPVIYQTLSAMPESTAQIKKIVELSAEEFEMEGGNYDPYGRTPPCAYRFDLQNPVSFELRNLHELFVTLRVVFMWIGIVFVVFASLLFSNFIATSISYKKREIGILRAIGSRSNDVFRIFFAESFIIAMINFVLSFAGVAVICAVINGLVRNNVGLLLTILNVGPRQIILLFGICLLVAAAASFLPVRKIAAKRPIDAIRDR